MLLLTYNAIYSPAHKLKISETETLLTVCYHLLLCLHFTCTGIEILEWGCLWNGEVKCYKNALKCMVYEFCIPGEWGSGANATI